MYDRSYPATELSPSADPACDEEIDTLDLLERHVQTATLPIGAREAYELFCDPRSLRHWVSVVSSARVLERDPGGRATRVAFLAKLENACIGYTLHYRYHASELKVTWATSTDTATRVAGRAYFLPLGERACLMHYELSVDVPSGALPIWDDPVFNANAASAVVNDFRDYIHRMK